MNYNERLSGNEAIAFAMKQIDPDVMAAFPSPPPRRSPSILPSTWPTGK